MEQKVMVLNVPAMLRDTDLESLRDFVLESLQMGVLILGTGVTWKLVDIPDLGGVVVGGPEPPGLLPPWRIEPQPEPPPEADTGPATFYGQHAAEKRGVYERLLRYRKEQGLGCLQDLAGGELTDCLLRAALCGEKLPIGTWRLIGEALTRAEG